MPHQLLPSWGHKKNLRCKSLTLLHSKQPKLFGVLAVLSTKGLISNDCTEMDAKLQYSHIFTKLKYQAFSYNSILGVFNFFIFNSRLVFIAVVDLTFVTTPKIMNSETQKSHQANMHVNVSKECVSGHAQIRGYSYMFFCCFSKGKLL